MSSENVVPSVHSVVTPTELYLALRSEWRVQVGTEPSRASLLVLLSQWSLETGNGAACMNYNLGGIKYTPGCGTNYAVYKTFEFINGQRIELDQKFRAYPSLNVSVMDYMTELRKTFGYAWPAVEAGDVKDFAHRLKLRGYYTAPELQYASGLEARQALLERTIGEDTDPEIPAAPVADAVAQARDQRIADGPTVDPIVPDPPDQPA